MNETTKRNNLKQAIAEELENTLDYDAWFFNGREGNERYEYERSIYYSVLLALDDFTEEELQRLIEEDEDTRWEYLDGRFWTSDTVTGNASGSFFCNTWKAEAALAHNWELIEDVKNEWGSDFDFSSGAEYIDVCIRCYLSSQIYGEVLESVFERFDRLNEGQNEIEAQEELNDVLTENADQQATKEA